MKSEHSNILFILSILIVLFQVSSFAEEKKSENLLLKNVPGKAGPHIEKIKAMPDNSWLILGKPAADPKWGMARGRSWTPKMAYASDLKGAFFCAEGVHGFIKPNGHIMDDLWFYEPYENKWICLFPGNHAKTLKLTLDKNGFEVNEKGDYTPIAYLGHGYNNMTYIPDIKKYFIIHLNSQYWTGTAPQRKTWAIKGKFNNNSKHPILYNTVTGKWERQFVEGKGPSGKYQGIVEYISKIKKVLYIFHGTVWYYDIQKKTWENTKVKAPVPYDSNGTYDSKRNRLIAVKGKGLWIFDIDSNKWITPTSKNQPEDLPSCNAGTMYYDSVNDAVVVNRNGKSKGKMRIYDLEKEEWVVPEVTFPEQEVRKKFNSYLHYAMPHGFYHPELNVHFYYYASDSKNKRAVMMAYRYKKVSPKK